MLTPRSKRSRRGVILLYTQAIIQMRFLFVEISDGDLWFGCSNENAFSENVRKKDNSLKFQMRINVRVIIDGL